MVAGRARHADSMGNRATVLAPGMQWMQAGSGIEHAEGGGSPKGEIGHGFQIVRHASHPLFHLLARPSLLSLHVSACLSFS